MTADDWDHEVFRIGAIKTLACAYNQEHNWADDEDPSATTELIREVEAIHTYMLAKLGERPARPKPEQMDPNLPF